MRDDNRPSIWILACSVLAARAVSGAPADITRYVALVHGGQKAGQQVVTRDADGTTRVDYVFKDNGRGPELKEEYVLDPDGTYAAEWRSTSDQGRPPVTGPALYSPLGGSPDSLSVAIAALSKHPDGRLPLIPSGTLTMRALAGVEVSRGADRKKVQLLALTGIGFAPTFAWATTDKSPRLFAVIFPGFLQRFYLVAEKTADLDFDSKPVQDFIALLAARQIVVDPTLATFDFLQQRAGEISQAYAAVADHMPPDVKRGLLVGGMNIPDAATAARYTKSYGKLVDLVGRMYRAGVPIVAGTDATPGFTLHRELELYVTAGLTPPQALQVATWNGAKYARLLGDRGSITPGKRADLVLVDGDPTRNVSDLRKIALVLKEGKAYYPSEVYEALGVKPFTEPVRAVPAKPSAR